MAKPALQAPSSQREELSAAHGRQQPEATEIPPTKPIVTACEESALPMAVSDSPPLESPQVFSRPWWLLGGISPQAPVQDAPFAKRSGATERSSSSSTSSSSSLSRRSKPPCSRVVRTDACGSHSDWGLDSSPERAKGCAAGQTLGVVSPSSHGGASDPAASHSHGSHSSPLPAPPAVPVVWQHVAQKEIDVPACGS